MSTYPQELAPFELGETLFRSIVQAHDGDPETLRDAVLEAAWGAETLELSKLSASDAKTLLAEPHVLGWLHQFLHEDERAKSFRDHTANENKHTSNFISTQLYTPRWVADFLADRAFQLAGSCVAFDPACGGGQMLLAWVDRLLAEHIPPQVAFKSVRGVDLDASAVEACRAGLKLHAFRVLGSRDLALEEALDAAITCGDSLRQEFGQFKVVITNPPYMGSRSMPPELKSFVAANYRPFHLDLYTAFIARCHELSSSVVAILAQQTLWYVARYEAARKALLESVRLDAFAHLGPRVFRSLTGEKANVVAFVTVRDGTPNSCEFWDLRHLPIQAKRTGLAHAGALRDVASFDAIPGTPMAHWLAKPLLETFEKLGALGDVALVPGSQNKTGQNKRYVRLAADTPTAQIRPTQGLRASDNPEATWLYYSKGGRFAPWWGNWDWLVDWSDEARYFYKSNRTSNLLAKEWWGREGLCYSDFGGQRFAARWLPKGAVFDMAGPAIFHPNNDQDRLLAWMVLLNSSAARALLNALNPSIHYQVRDVRRLPIPELSESEWHALSALGKELRDTTKSLLEDGGDWEALGELEWKAEQIVAAHYNVVPKRAPAHHRATTKPQV